MSKNILNTGTLKVAMYLRLSQDDEKYDKGFKVESNTIGIRYKICSQKQRSKRKSTI